MYIDGDLVSDPVYSRLIALAEDKQKSAICTELRNKRKDIGDFECECYGHANIAHG